MGNKDTSDENRKSRVLIKSDWHRWHRTVSRIESTGNGSKHRRQCRSTLFPKAENFRSTIIDSGTTSQSQNILIICKLYHFIFGWVGRTLLHSLTVRFGMASRTGDHTQSPINNYMRMRDSKKVGIMGIIQPKMLFSRIRISHASGLDSCQKVIHGFV